MRIDAGPIGNGPIHSNLVVVVVVAVVVVVLTLTL